LAVLAEARSAEPPVIRATAARSAILLGMIRERKQLLLFMDHLYFGLMKTLAKRYFFYPD
jgi:hypothetical protein